MKCNDIDNEGLSCAYLNYAAYGDFCKLQGIYVNSDDNCKCSIERAQALADQLLYCGETIRAFVSLEKVDDK